MVLTVHHLGVSQSERIVWLCEELGIQYELKKYNRAPLLSPPEYQALHPIGAAPVITDGNITLAESEACVEYIINIHGKGALTVKPGQDNYADYLYWYYFTNGSLQPAIGRALVIATMPGAGDSDSPILARFVKRLKQYFALIDGRLENATWLAGDEFTAADIMMMFSLSTMRKFSPQDLSEYPNILAWFQRVVKRDGYQRAMKKGEPDLDVQDLIQGPPPKKFAAMP